MKRAAFVFFVFFYLSGFSQRDTSRTYFPNGSLGCLEIKINSTTAYKTFYTKNGEKAEEGVMRDSYRIGHWRFYYPNGKMQYEGKMVKAKTTSAYKRNPNPKHGKWIYYNEKGGIDYRVWYKNGHTKKLLQYTGGKRVYRYWHLPVSRWGHDSFSPYKADF